MRILVHDYAGHPFQVQLSRELARRGHEVLHAYCASLQTTPQATLRKLPEDPAGFEVQGLQLRRPLQKFSFTKRWLQENEYGRLLKLLVRSYRPDVVLSANTPLDAQRALLRECRALDARFVYWAQDLLGIATHRLLSQKHPLLGATIGRYYALLERRLIGGSDHAVLITEDFRPVLKEWHIRTELSVIENWAPLEDMPVRPKRNPWSLKHELADKVCLLYSGTLGMKHNPGLLLDLARRFEDEPDVRVVVVSQGLGADWLRKHISDSDVRNLIVMGFQDFDDMPDVLATGEVLLAVLEPDAGVFSVPSKVLSYLCAARPVLLAVPPENLAARLVEQQQAGFVVKPNDSGAFVDRAALLVAREDLRRDQGARARRYAEAAFDIQRKTTQFEQVLTSGL